MRIIVDVNEVFVPIGQYGEPDDMLCKGCGRMLTITDSHTVLDCLQELKRQIDKLKDEVALMDKV